MSYPSSTSNIKAIIFDCDGTLVASDERHFLAWQQAVHQLGGNLDRKELLSFVGRPDLLTAHALAEKFGYDCAEELFSLKRRIFQESIHDQVTPIIETVIFLKQLIKEKQQWNLKLALASAAIKYEIVTHLKLLGLENAFDLVLSGHDDLAEYGEPNQVNKPHPYIYLHAAKLLGVTPAECIVIEDSVIGVKAAIDAGCITVAVPTIYSKHHDLSQATLCLETFAGVSVADFLEMATSATYLV